MMNFMSDINDYMTIGLDRLVIHRSDWLPIIKQEMEAPYFPAINRFLYTKREKDITILPLAFDVFSAFAHCSYRGTRVVIIGQDPYFKREQANGLAFSVPYKTELPPSLRNIFRELRKDQNIHKDCYLNPNLGSWASQGVLLLNSIMTVDEGKPMSHKDIGWETFTEAIIDYLCLKQHPIVFLLLGKEAQKFAPLVSKGHHKIELPHPSPHSAHKGFFFSRPFTKVNQILSESGMGTIDWSTLVLGRRAQDG